MCIIQKEQCNIATSLKKIFFIIEFLKVNVCFSWHELAYKRNYERQKSMSLYLNTKGIIGFKFLKISKKIDRQK